MKTKYTLPRWLAAPMTREDFIRAAFFVLIVGKGLSAGAILYLEWLDTQVELSDAASWIVVGFCTFFMVLYWIPYIVLLCRRADALGSVWFGDPVIGSSLFIFFSNVYERQFDMEPFTDPIHYAMQAALLLSLALFQDKQVSGTGYILENGRYRKPESVEDGSA